VLVLGGGDGLAVREILKYPQIESVTLVDLDPAMTRLFSQTPLLTSLNHNALNSPKVKVINTDAFVWLEQNQDAFDFIVVDFPDPTNYAVGKLYTNTFYRLLERHPQRPWPGGDPGHLAAVRPAIVLDRGQHRRKRRFDDTALPRTGADVWRMGLHPLRPRAVYPAATTAGRAAFHQRQPATNAVPVCTGHGTRRDRDQPPQQSESGAQL
jgi:hypothetical protein